MVYLWYSKATSVTGRELAQRLGLTRTSPNDKQRQYGTLPPPIGTTICISYGARPSAMNERRLRRLKQVQYINDPWIINNFSDKHLALETMHRAGVSVPSFTNNKNEAIRKILNGIELIGRTKSHYAGKGFKYIQSNSDLRNDTQSNHWLEYITAENSREYRVHVFKGEVIKVSRKMPKLDEEGNEIEPISEICKSHDNGWRFSTRNISRIHPSILDEARKAVSALEYDFGAVDIIRCPSNNSTYVLEVNSGMGLEENGLELYTTKFNEELST